MASVEISEIRAIRSVEDAVAFAKRLGYKEAPVQMDLDDLGLSGFSRHAFIRSGKNKRQGYGLLIGEMPAIPRSLTSLGRSLRALHDHPLAIIGIPDASGRWNNLVVIRPRLVKSGSAYSYRTGRMEVDLAAPSRHDAEVLGQIAWRASAQSPQNEVDDAFDVEAVTRRFFTGLRTHFDAIEANIASCSQTDTAVAAGVKGAGGARRVAIRLISQILFCFFLQRKGLLAGDPRYLVTLWSNSRLAKRRYHDTLEDLFYETLSKPETTRTDLAHASIPFLNGGLFERAYGDIRLGLNDSLFDLDDGLLGFLTHWTFTLHEETPDENDVAVDPELLGRVFEHLVSDEEQAKHGVVYTPRPVVQFMCREALITWLLGRDTNLTEAQIRLLLSDNDALAAIRQDIGTSLAADVLVSIDEAFAAITVLDPAVGSGAFLLGMLGEIIRIRQMIFAELQQRAATPLEIHDWKLHAIENTLFGVDIEPLALELCRLRLWLSLIVEIDAGGEVHPLPNLEYRTVAGNSLTDFVGGVEVQNIRKSSASQQPMDFAELGDITKARDAFFGTADPTAKSRLRKEINEQEAALVERVLSLASGRKQDAAKSAFLDGLRVGFKSRDRVFPVFMPAFHFPEVYTKGGWDIVIANPPYLGKKEVAKRLHVSVQRDYEQHFGDTNDLLALFGERMFDFVKDRGVGAMIGNDSYLTSTDAVPLRLAIMKNATITTLARTNCFEGQAVNGAVVVWRQGPPAKDAVFRWVEAYNRDLRDFAGASMNVLGPLERAEVGEMEVIGARSEVFTVLPSRVFFRPSHEALHCLQLYATLYPAQFRTLDGWEMSAKTARLKKLIKTLRATGVYDRLNAGQFVPLGICIEGGPGLQTGDDRRFLAAIENTDDGDKCARDRIMLLQRIRDNPVADSRLTRDQASGLSEDEALLRLAEDPKLEKALKFPRLLRVAQRSHIFNGPLTAVEIEAGLKGARYFIPFEKGDRSGEDESGNSIAARWIRENPIVIDWSSSAVDLLHKRYSSKESRHKPYFRNEALWGKGGISWNSIARYLRVRLVAPDCIFGHKTPIIRSIVDWLDEYSLLALLNSDAVEFILKTFLGSLMQIEVGDLRRIPIPVLTAVQSKKLSEFGKRAVSLTLDNKTAEVASLEQDLNTFVRGLYGISREANLWVTR